MADEPLRQWEAWKGRRDERAFEDLVRPDLGRAVALARAEGCPPGEAEDAVQESLIRLAREKSNAPAEVGVRGWFFGVVRDRARARRRSDRRRQQREQAAAVPEAMPGSEARYALRDEVEKALSVLAEEEREALRLRYLLDLDYREVAYVLGVSEGACRMRVLRALKRIRSILGAGAGAALAAVVLPAPARASTWITSAASSVPGVPVAGMGGVIAMTVSQKSLVAAAAAGLLGVALGAGVASSIGSGNAASERERADREIGNLRREVNAAKAERDRAVGQVEGLRREKMALVAERDSLASRVEGRGPIAASSQGKPGPSPPAVVDPTAEIQKRAGDLSRKWVEDAVQIKDEAKRNEAIAAIRSALSSGDQIQTLAGLFAVSAIGQVPYDKASMRSLVLSQFEAESPLLRKAAVNCVLATSQGPDPANLDLLLRLKDDPSSMVRRELAPAVSWAARGDLTGAAGDVVLRVMEEIEAEEEGPPKGGKSELIRQLGGRTYFRRMSPEIEEKILALARNPETQQSALHFFFQNMEKSAKVVDVLIEIAEAGGTNSSNAIRALTYEVPPEQAPRVAAFLVKVLENGPSYQAQQVLFGLRNFGTEAELPAMERLAANELVDASSRRMIAEAVEFIRKRVRR